MIEERGVVFECEGNELLGIVSSSAGTADLGVVIIVGGPQYRAGSHRQFVRLARHLAGEAYPTLRFDCRGMGDSAGEPRRFEDIESDIRAAVDCLVHSEPQVRRIVLWGLCDAASAAMMYAPSDPRIVGLVLANPWVRSVETHAKTMLVHYYASRLLSRAFWKKFVSNAVDLRRSAGELWGNVKSTATVGLRTDGFRLRMADGMARFRGSALFLVCERDLTAREFEDFARTHLSDTLGRRNKRDQWARFPDADHTFSGPVASSSVAQTTAHWLTTVFNSATK